MKLPKVHKHVITANKILVNFVIFLIVPLVLFLFITSRTPAIFGIRSFDVVTGSMEPTIHVGSIVFTVPQATYEKGDIVTFKRGDISITHRIVNINKDSFVTKGDANKAFDPQPVYKGTITGKDVLILPFIGRITSFIKTPLGFTLIMVIPTLLFIAFESAKIKKEIEHQVEARVRKEYEKVQS